MIRPEVPDKQRDQNSSPVYFLLPVPVKYEKYNQKTLRWEIRLKYWKISDSFCHDTKVYRLKVREWKKLFCANGNHKKASVAILKIDKADFKTKTVTRNKEGHYIMIKASIQEEDKIIVNIYAPNMGPPKYTKQILRDIKGEIDSNNRRI